MGKKKSKKQEKKERREREAAEREALLAKLEQRRRVMRWTALAVPLVTLAIALSIYFATDDRQLAALVGLVGIALWVPVLLGAVGGAVRPRDRTRAGSIDFGNRR